MVAQEKSTWLGCVLTASLFVLALSGCGDVSESSQTSQSSKQSKPTETAESHAAAGDGPANCQPTQPDMLGPFYEPGAPVRTSVGRGIYSQGPCWPPKSASRSPTPASSSGWPTLEGNTTMHTGLRCLPAREEGIAWRATCPSPTAAGRPTSTFG
jgi:hypothetical protein